MATPLRPDDLDDFVESTLNYFFRDAWRDISLPLQRYYATRNFLLGNKVGFRGGTMLEWKVQVENSGQAVNTGLYDRDEAFRPNVMTKARVPWAYVKVPMTYDVREDDWQSGPERIISVVRELMHIAMNDRGDLFETNFWGKPADSTTAEEKLKPYGVPYYIVRNATQGFNGGAPSGHTTVAELNPTTYTAWKNYTDQYADIAKRDAVRRIRRAIDHCGFEPIDPHPDVIDDGRRWNLCMTYEPYQRLDELAEEQNQNLGTNLASMDDRALIRRFQKYWIPKLDNLHDSAGTDANNAYGKNPIYGLPLHAFKAFFKTGWYMKRTPPQPAPDAHNQRVIWWDDTCNFVMYDRRSAFVLTQS